MKKININYPIQESVKGDYVEMTTTKKEAIKSNLLFFLTTRKGSRYMNPDFGTNLEKFLFEPLDDFTKTNIQDDITTSVMKSFPNITIDSIEIVTSDSHTVAINIQFSYNP